MDKKTMLYDLRNPYKLTEIDLLEVTSQAADELERLYKREEEISNYLSELKSLKKLLHS